MGSDNFNLYSTGLSYKAISDQSNPRPTRRRFTTRSVNHLQCTGSAGSALQTQLSDLFSIHRVSRPSIFLFFILKSMDGVLFLRAQSLITAAIRQLSSCLMNIIVTYFYVPAWWKLQHILKVQYKYLYLYIRFLQLHLHRLDSPEGEKL